MERVRRTNYFQLWDLGIAEFIVDDLGVAIVHKEYGYPSTTKNLLAFSLR